MNQLVGKYLAALALCLAAAASCQAAANNFSVFATGLNNPHGLKFGPDGNLYVAEGGVGGSNSTANCCEQAGLIATGSTGDCRSRPSGANVIAVGNDKPERSCPCPASETDCQWCPYYASIPSRAT